LAIRFSNHTQPTSQTQPTVTGLQKWRETPVESAYIPVREMLSNGAQLVALYRLRELDIEEVHIDIIERAMLPLAKGPTDADRQRLLDKLRREMRGKVEIVDGRFFHRSTQGRLEFPLLAEGYRKLGLLWLLIQNRTLLRGSVLFWDEPEANLNPALIGCAVDILLELQRLGVQVFVTTHSYVTLKEVELLRRTGDEVRYVSLQRDAADVVQAETAQRLEDLAQNKIRDTYVDLVERDLKLSL
jgi:predicted ATPase